MTSGARTTIKAAFAAVLFVVAGWLFFRGTISDQDEVPDTAESATWWYCPNCKNGFALTAREVDRRLFTGAHPDLPADGPRDTTRLVRMVRCPTCEKGAVGALKCPQDGTVFEVRSASGEMMRCPTCGFDPAQREDLATEE
jgi:predicted RNA-binding Zn-ribbon protein involved in translation (DUF1610 family)